MEGLGSLISPSRNIYDAAGLGEKARMNHPRLRTRRKTWAGFLDNRPQSAPSEAFFTRFADIGEDEVLVSMFLHLDSRMPASIILDDFNFSVSTYLSGVYSLPKRFFTFWKVGIKALTLIQEVLDGKHRHS